MRLKYKHLYMAFLIFSSMGIRPFGFSETAFADPDNQLKLPQADGNGGGRGGGNRGGGDRGGGGNRGGDDRGGGGNRGGDDRGGGGNRGGDDRGGGGNRGGDDRGGGGNRGGGGRGGDHIDDNRQRDRDKHREERRRGGYHGGNGRGTPERGHWDRGYENRKNWCDCRVSQYVCDRGSHGHHKYPIDPRYPRPHYFYYNLYAEIERDVYSQESIFLEQFIPYLGEYWDSELYAVKIRATDYSYDNSSVIYVYVNGIYKGFVRPSIHGLDQILHIPGINHITRRQSIELRVVGDLYIDEAIVTVEDVRYY